MKFTRWFSSLRKCLDTRYTGTVRCSMRATWYLPYTRASFKALLNSSYTRQCNLTAVIGYFCKKLRRDAKFAEYCDYFSKLIKPRREVIYLLESIVKVAWECFLSTFLKSFESLYYFGEVKVMIESERDFIICCRFLCLFSW